MRIKILALLSLLLSACTPVSLQTPAASPQPVRVAITPTIETWVQPRLTACRAAIPGLYIVTQPANSRPAADIQILIGEKTESSAEMAYIIGSLQLQILAHPDLDTAALDIETLRDAYTQISPSEIEVWSYPTGHELRDIFNAQLEIETISPYARLAMTPEQMLAKIASQPNALGYAPVFVGANGNQILPLLSVEKIPILAHTPTPTTGPAKQLLACLQQQAETP